MTSKLSRLRAYFDQARQMPPHIFAMKVLFILWKWGKSYYQFKRDSHTVTYRLDAKIPIGHLNNYISLIDIKLLEGKEWLAGVTQNYLAHRFDLLGSGWVLVKYGMHCQGLEGYRYKMGNPVTADREGKWLEGRINAANLSESKRIWSLIDKDYMPIDWHLDFKSGYRWSESTWFQKIKYGHKPGVDIKVPWELARMQHLPQFALAYALTPDTIYVNEFRHQILDFIATNPPRFGVNWRCTMDVGIRIANWLVAYDLFMAHGAEFDAAFMTIFKRSIYEHGHHIINHLEGSPTLRSNHYLADIVGLLYAAAYLPSSKEIDAWLAFAVDEVIKEVKIQFHPDGSNFEASTSYHRLSGELVIYATLLILGATTRDCPYKHLKRRGNPLWLPSWYIERLQKMAEFTMDMTRPDGLIPQIGDNDSGRFIKLSSVHQRLSVREAKARYCHLKNYKGLPEEADYWDEVHLDHRHLVSAINGLFKRDDFAKFAGNVRIEQAIIEQLAGHVCRPASSDKGIAHGTQTAYPDFGLYLYRDERVYLAIRCGSNGQNGNGGHAHNDQLSFELAIDGITLISDPGTY
ncbi:MAG: heparinase, partial [Candidatus Parabeggiatoa sp. nov. 1]